MKLKEIAQIAIDILKEKGPEGINNAELAEIIGVHKRRVYDIIAILKAADLIHTERSGAGTHLTWTGAIEEPVRKMEETPNSIFTSKLKVSTNGNIFNVANRGNAVVIELDNPAELNLEPTLD